MSIVRAPSHPPLDPNPLIMLALALLCAITCPTAFCPGAPAALEDGQ